MDMKGLHRYYYEKTFEFQMTDNKSLFFIIFMDLKILFMT